MPSKDPEYHKKWYQRNKQKHKEYCGVKIKCEICGAVFARSNATAHKKTQKHMKAKVTLRKKYEQVKKELDEIKSSKKSGSKTIKKIVKSKSKKEKKVNIGDIIDVENYAPKGYDPYLKSKTTLTKINKDPIKKEQHIKKLKRKGRITITTKKELENFPLGSLVSYLTKDGKYRSGGFLKSIQDKYFVIQGGTSAKPISFCAQFKNIDEMYLKNKEAYEDNDK